MIQEFLILHDNDEEGNEVECWTILRKEPDGMCRAIATCLNEDDARYIHRALEVHNLQEGVLHP